MGGDGGLSRAGSFTRKPGLRTWTTRASRVVVIGSGATAATLVPAIAADCGHVTMLQRSPTFFRTGRNAIELADELRALQIDEAWIHEIVRKKILYEQDVFTRRSFTEPEAVKQELLDSGSGLSRPRLRRGKRTSRRRTGHGGSASPSFRTATCSRVSATDKASVVTDEIDRFTETGILLKSGRHLDADIIVTATGFNLNVLGDIAFSIDGEPLNLFRHRHLSRHDVHRRAQHGMGVRVLSRQLDAARGSGR